MIASGFQTLTIGFRAFIDYRHGGGHESKVRRRADEVRWLRPVRPGDTLHTIFRVLDARPSNSKPDRGILSLSFRVLNQSNEDVLSFSTTMFVLRRPS